MTIMVPNSKNGQPVPLMVEVKFWLAILFIAVPFGAWDLLSRRLSKPEQEEEEC